jgi:CRISPR-associated protein Cas4
MSVTLSYTSFSAYRSCPEFFRRKYVDRIKPSIPQNNRWFIEGSVIHECLEKGFAHSRPLDKEYVVSIFDSTFDKVYAEQSTRGVIVLLSIETKDMIRAKCKELLNCSISTIQKMGMDQGEFYSELPVGTYKEPFELVKGLYIQGSVDWVRDSGTSLTVSDFKTSKDMTYVKALQLLIYSMALEKKLGKPVEKAFYLMFRSGAQVKIDLSEAERKKAIGMLTEANNNIKSGKFEAKPSDKTCKECVFRNMCKFCSIKFGPQEISFGS